MCLPLSSAVYRCLLATRAATGIKMLRMSAPAFRVRVRGPSKTPRSSQTPRPSRSLARSASNLLVVAHPYTHLTHAGELTHPFGAHLLFPDGVPLPRPYTRSQQPSTYFTVAERHW